MSVPPESIQVSQCYLMVSGKVRRVIAIHNDRLEFGTGGVSRFVAGWTSCRSMTDLNVFASMIERHVPENWTIGSDEVAPSKSRER